LVGDDVTGLAVVGVVVGAGETVTGAAVGSSVGAAVGETVSTSVGAVVGATVGTATGASVELASVGAVVGSSSVGAATGVKVKNPTGAVAFCAAAVKRRNADVIKSFMMIINVVYICDYVIMMENRWVRYDEYISNKYFVI
jgi:hypothetical protein